MSIFAIWKSKAETLKINKKQELFKIKRIGSKILTKTSRNKAQYKFSIAEEGISDLEYIPEEIIQNSYFNYIINH